MSEARFEPAPLESARLRLCYPQQRDYRDWAALRLDSRHHLEPFEPAWPPDALTRDDWGRRLKSWRSGRKSGAAHVFLARRTQDGVLLGGAGLTSIRHGSAQSASLGYWLGAPFTGQGYMTEMVALLCAWGFEALDLERIEAGTVPENAASQAVLRRVGFKEEGRARAYLEIAGRRRDHILFGLVRGDLPG